MSKNVSFVLDNIQRYQSIANEASQTTRVYVLDTSKDVLAQMADILSTQAEPLDAIHLFSHGSSGELDLGSVILSNETINQYTDILAKIGSFLSADGDILLYGCDVGEGQSGVEFISKLFQETGADIAASNDLTGIAALGGDWVLETMTGNIEANGLVIAGYSGILAGVTIDNIAGDDVSTTTNIAAYIDNGSAAVITSGSGLNGGNILFDWWATHPASNFTADTYWLKFGADAGSADASPAPNDHVYVSDGMFWVDVGTVDTTFDGQSGRKLKISFTANVTDVLASQIVKSLEVNGTAPFTDSLSISVTDSGGAWDLETSVFRVVAPPNAAPTLTTMANISGATEDTQFQITFSDLQGAGNDDDTDGTVDAFVVQAVSSGTLKIGADAGSATAYDASTNNTIDATHQAFWTPAANTNGTLEAFTVKAKDNLGATSATAIPLNVVVTAVADAPVLDNTKSPALTTIAEDVGNPVNGSATGSTQVSDLIASGGITNFSDADGDPAGLAITGINTNGSLWYSTDNGTTWIQATGISATNALPLASSALIYFAPNANYSGSISDAITFRAWDGSSGTSGTVGLDASATLSLSMSGAVTSLTNNRTIDGSGNYVYITDSGSLKVIDISNPASPSTVGTVSTSGAEMVAVSGNYAYVAAWNSGLQVVNISNPASPTVVGSYTTGMSSIGTVNVDGNYAYLSSVSPSDGVKFYIFDISTPIAPSLLSTLNMGTSYARDVYISGNRAYVVHTDTTDGLQVIDISNPSSPHMLGGWTGSTYSVVVSGNYAYVSGLASQGDHLRVLDISDPAHITQVGTLNTGLSGALYNLTLSGTKLYAAHGTAGVQVIDISNPTSPVLEGAAVNTSGEAFNTLLIGDNLYVADSSDMQVITQIQTVGSSLSSASDTVSLTVSAVADTPSVTDATTTAATQTISGLVLSRNTVDGEEVTHFKITGITNGNLFKNDGTTAINNGDFITFAEGNAGLKFTPTGGGNGSFVAQASISNVDGGLGGSTVNATISVGAAVASPILNEDTDSGAIAITLGSSETHYKITSITGGTLFSDSGYTTAISSGDFIVQGGGGGDASTTNVYFRPTANANSTTGGNGSFIIQASTSNADAGLIGSQITSTVTLTAIADTPSVTDTVARTGEQNLSGLVLSRNAADGAEVTHFKITSITNGTLFKNDGTTVINNGDFITFAEGNAGLKFTPAGGGNGSFTAQASTSNANGGLGGSTVNATITLDDTAPVFQSAATSSDGTKVILTYDGVLNPTTASTNDFTVEVGGQTVTINSVAISGSTVELTLVSAVTNGQTVTVAYTDPTGGDDANAVQDSAGNDAVTFTATSVTNSVPTPASSGGTYTPPPVSSTIISGNNMSGLTTTTAITTTVGTSTVTTQTATGTRTYTDFNGQTITQNNITVEAIQVTSPGSSMPQSGPVPLYWGESSRTVWATTATIPTGITLLSEGNRAPTGTQTTQSAIENLIYYIQTTIPYNASTKAEMEANAKSFLKALSQIDNLVVNKIILTSNSGSTPSFPIIIQGTANSVTTASGTSAPTEAIVIDAHALPSGTILQLNNIEFVSIRGAVTLNGGDGRNTVFADDYNQFICLGADDDELHAGGGDDIVGSRGGDDLLYGDSGDDLVVGGAGNDTLYGGDGNDLLQGGQSDAGIWHFYISNNQVQATFNAKYSAMSDTDQTTFASWVNEAGHSITDDQRVSFTADDVQRVENIAMLYHAVTGNLPSVAELNYWVNSGKTVDELIKVAYDFFDATKGSGLSLEVKVATLIEQVFGNPDDALATIGVDFILNGGTWEDGLQYLNSNAQHTSRMLDNYNNLQLTTDWQLSETGWSSDVGNDSLYGGAGNDVLVGGRGNDLLDGGDGIDLAAFVGDINNHTVARVDGTTVVSYIFTGETKELTGIEMVQFGSNIYVINTELYANDSMAASAFSQFVHNASQEEIALVGVQDWIA